MAIALVAVCLASCAQNAVLELQMELPTLRGGGAPGSTDALVHVAIDTDGPENDGARFDGWNAGIDTPNDLGFALSQNRCPMVAGTFECNVRLSLVTTNVDADVIVQIRYCNPSNGSCDDDTPELRYHIEHPFYRGQRTYFRTGPLIRDMETYTYNISDDFPELCEQPDHPDRETRVIWRCRIEGCFDTTRLAYPSADYGWCVTASGPTFSAEDACVTYDGHYDDAANPRPDAGERVSGVVGGTPQHQCDLRGSSCSAAAPGASPGGGLALAGLALVMLARRRRLS